ncbi:Borealin N terminal-domain-containing protein [Elsinoe ampelina]|uniref:Borealin N terminal-domain-containing protein n=1 Tax=Elsinoe ampelina TaxID=302913 RepID=A0A6A6GLT1_9PEZI|nr:Borealin N terminal-domain-containing protein [Elsinoe ampelina]
MASTPEQMPAVGIAMGTIAISEARKQMLIDNLQLEITERARKLRAQYALQAQGLKSRIELRVNRIPRALRYTTMQDLVDKHSKPQPSKTLPAPPSPQKISYPALSATTGNARGIKRTSDVMPNYDKENEHPAGALENPKKRVKTTAGISAVATKPSRTASRKAGPAAVLSPKSHNSRTFPTSPIKSASPVKESVLPKPISRALGPAASKSVRPASRQTKRPAANTSQPMSSRTIPESSGLTAHNRPSSGSDDSNGTTIVKKPAARATATTTSATAKKAATATATKSRTQGLKNALSSLTGSKRGLASKKGTAVAPTATVTHASSTTTVGGRTLRKRG